MIFCCDEILRGAPLSVGRAKKEIEDRSIEIGYNPGAEG